MQVVDVAFVDVAFVEGATIGEQLEGGGGGARDGGGGERLKKLDDVSNQPVLF